ncbi:MAG: diguanylate cyclase [Rhodocyclaceae bacterium]|nr:diguanylate cyclase [Rhodocyclaceae bacterium]
MIRTAASSSGTRPASASPASRPARSSAPEEHWRGFYDSPRPCLADLLALGRTAEIDALYAEHDHADENAVSAHGRRAENWCVMPRAGTRLYLAIDAGPIYDDSGKLIAVVETLRDMTAQKEAQAELERLATRDGLTSVANRRSFDQILDSEWRRATRESRSLSLLMIDVDYFKRFNDSYGHQGGDECLRQVAAAMSGVVKRTSDCVARYGGEEFTVLMPATEPEGALIVAERIRAAVEALALPHSAVRDRRPRHRQHRRGLGACHQRRPVVPTARRWRMQPFIAPSTKAATVSCMDDSEPGPAALIPPARRSLGSPASNNPD